MMEKNKRGMWCFVLQDYVIGKGPASFLKVLRILFSINKVGKINIWVRLNQWCTLYSHNLLLRYFARHCHNHILKWYSCEISPYASIGSGIHFPHPIGIIIGGGVIIGSNVTIYHHVTIGRKEKILDEYPKIEDNCVLYAGSSVIGNVTLAQGTIVGAHALVTHSTLPERRYVGIPAKIVDQSESNK